VSCCHFEDANFSRLYSFELHEKNTRTSIKENKRMSK
jgi:hypothetical protein